MLALASAGLISFLGLWEGTDRTVYADKLANGLPTACGGITKAVSPYPVIVGDVWSRERCDEVIGMVTAGTQLSMATCIKDTKKLYITQNIFDAFTSHAHNFGWPSTCASQAMGFLNNGDYEKACRALSLTPDGKPNWSSVTMPDGSKKFVQGLYNRRRAETTLCLKP